MCLSRHFTVFRHCEFSERDDNHFNNTKCDRFYLLAFPLTIRVRFWEKCQLLIKYGIGLCFSFSMLRIIKSLFPFQVSLIQCFLLLLGLTYKNNLSPPHDNKDFLYLPMLGRLKRKIIGQTE